MREYINKKIISKDKNTIIVSLICIVLISFFLTNTHLMFSLQGSSDGNQDLIRKYLSLAPFKTCILYFIYGAFIVCLLKEKRTLFRDIDEGIHNLSEVFVTKYLTIISVITVSSLVVSLFKLVAYLINKDIFIGASIGISRVIMFFIIFTLVSITSSSLVFLAMFLINNNLIALILLPMIEYSLFLLFGLFSLLISDYLLPLQWLFNKISTLLVDYFVYFIVFDWRIELNTLGLQLLSILFFILVNIILCFLSYKAMRRIKGEVINKDYYFLCLKKVMTVILSFIGAFTIFVFLDLLALILAPKSFDKINLGTNIFMIILSIVLYKILNIRKFNKKVEQN